MINFPNNPAIGDAFNQGGTIYTCVLISPVVWNAAPAAAGIPDAPLDGLTYGRNTAAWKALDKTDVGLDKVDNTSDLAKPISTATAGALAGKEMTIAPGGTAQYWRGDKTWQVLNAAAAGAVAKTGDTMTGALTISPPGAHAALTLDAPAGFTPYLAARVGGTVFWQHNMDNDYILHRYDNSGAHLGAQVSFTRGDGTVNLYGNTFVTGIIQGSSDVRAAGNLWAEGGSALGIVANGDYPYLRFTADNWRWQMTRSTGDVNWVHPNGTVLGGISGGGNVSGVGNGTFNGRITVNNSTDQASFYSPQGGVRVDGGGNCVYAPNGSMYAGGDMNCSTIFARSVIRVNPQNGMQYDPQFLDQGGGSYRCCIAFGIPNYGNFTQNFYHQSGSWVGWNIQSSDGKELRWSGQSGTANADAFSPWSDRRLKTNIVPIDNPRSRVAKLIGCTYTKINTFNYDGTPHVQAGLIAQDALEALPESVELIYPPTTDNENLKTLTTEDMRYTLDYAAIIGLLVNDNNAMAARIDVLEAKLLEISP